MKTKPWATDSIKVGDQRRSLDAATVDRLAESMQRFGLLQPIVLYDPKDDADDVYLVAGRHRLAAATKLGWEWIDVIFLDSSDEIDRRLCEITENLHRAELTVQERSDQIAEWADLIEQKNKLAQVAQVSGGRGNKGGESQVARDLGLDRREVERANKIANITPEAKQAAKDAGLDDNQSALLEVAAVPATKQAEKVSEIAAKKKKSKSKPRKKKETSTKPPSRNPIATAWEKASGKQRETFTRSYSVDLRKYLK